MANTSFENLKARQSIIAPGNIKKSSSFEALKQRVGTTSQPSSVSSTSIRDVRGGIIGDILTGSTQRFGKTIGESLVAPENAEKYSRSLESHTNIQNSLIKTIKEKKKLGQDTARLEDVLKEHVATTPKIEDFTGDVINKTPKQIIGEGIGTGLEALSGGVLSSAKKALTSKALTTSQKVAEGAGIGATYGGIGGATSAMQENKSIGGIVGEGLLGASIGGITGGALGGATAGLGKIGSIIEKRAIARKEKIAKDFDDTVQRILQGDKKDVDIGKKILSSFDPEDVKSYKDLSERVNEKIEVISNKLDDVLETNPSIKTLNNLSYETTVAGQKVKQNFVEDALQQLDVYYTKTNNPTGKARIAQLRQKATTQGLSVKEVNDLAKLHGQDLSAYNASGELASGLSRQAAENTRMGLKSTVRQNFGDKVAQEADKEISNLIRVRTLANDMVEKVNDLQKKIMTRGFGERVGRLISQVLDISSGGILKGSAQYFLPRGEGIKLLNALDLEKQLSKNLKLIREAAQEGVSEKNIIDKLEQVIRNAGTKQEILRLPAPGDTTSGIQKPFYVTPKGKVTAIAQEASDIAAVESRKTKISPSKTRKLPDVMMQEPYTEPSKLPVIQIGRGKKK